MVCWTVNVQLQGQRVKCQAYGGETRVFGAARGSFLVQCRYMQHWTAGRVHTGQKQGEDHKFKTQSCGCGETQGMQRKGRNDRKVSIGGNTVTRRRRRWWWWWWSRRLRSVGEGKDNEAKEKEKKSRSKNSRRRNRSRKRSGRNRRQKVKQKKRRRKAEVKTAEGETEVEKEPE